FGFCPGPLPRPYPHWTCFGYCPRPGPYYTCFGYCPGPLPSPYYSCYGYCPYGPGMNVYAPSVAPTPGYDSLLTPPPAAPTQPPDKDDKKEPTYKGKTVAEWVKVLKNWDSQERGRAADALARLGPKARDAIPNLIDTLKDSDPMVRVEAASALAAIGTDAIEPLEKALKNSDKYIRMGAALALGHLGPKAKD